MINHNSNRNKIHQNNEAIRSRNKRSKRNKLNQNLILKEHDELHIIGGNFLKSLIYAGVDGTLNVLIIILSGISSLTSNQVLTICISVIVADGIGMGFGDYISVKAQADFIKSEQQRQLYQVENNLAEEKKQIIHIYIQKGYQLEQAQILSDLFSTNTQAFVNIMMLEELKLVKIDQSSAYKYGIVTFFSFMFFGIIPIIPYIIVGLQEKNQQPWIYSTSIGMLQLFALGYLKGHLIQINKWKSGAEIMILGAVVTAIGYGIGFIFA